MTKQDLINAIKIAQAIAETVREAREVPEGTLYAALIGKVTLDGFNSCLALLERSSLITRDASHVVRWVGPDIGLPA